MADGLPQDVAAQLAAKIAAIEERLRSGDDRMASIQAELASNTSVTREIREVMIAARVGFRVLGGLGLAAKWLGMLITGALAIWGAWQTFRNGIPPGK